jgi:hypothetical protein
LAAFSRSNSRIARPGNVCDDRERVDVAALPAGIPTILSIGAEKRIRFWPAGVVGM